MPEIERLQRQNKLLREGLEWALATMGWCEFYYAPLPPPKIILTLPLGAQVPNEAKINEQLLNEVEEVKDA